MADHEDYLPGEAPAAHKVSHQDGGADEISVAALSGELADDQPTKAHDLGGAKHNADTLANLNAKIIATTLDDSGDPRDPNAHKLSHQNGGADEISVAALSGELLDAQLPKSHIITGEAHTADNLANLNLLITDADLDDSGDPRDPNAHKLSHQNGGADEISVAGLAGEGVALAAHRILPTVHQDAPGLIATHATNDDAHHPKAHDHDGDTLKLDGINSNGGAFTFSTTGDKTLDQRILKPDQPAFSAYVNATQNNITGDGTAYSATGNIWTERYDRGGNFSEGTFTAPVDGLYAFTAILYIKGMTVSHTLAYCRIVTSNKIYYVQSLNPSALMDSNNRFLISGSILADMDSDDLAYIDMAVFNGAKVIDFGMDNITFFTGFLAC